MLTITDEGLDYLDRLESIKYRSNLSMPEKLSWDWTVLKIIAGGESSWRGERNFLDYWPGKNSPDYQNIRDALRRMFEIGAITKEQEEF